MTVNCIGKKTLVIVLKKLQLIETLKDSHDHLDGSIKHFATPQATKILVSTRTRLKVNMSSFPPLKSNFSPFAAKNRDQYGKIRVSGNRTESSEMVSHCHGESN